MKTDKVLGQEVRDYLIMKGVETPIKESNIQKLASFNKNASDSISPVLA